MTLYEYFTREGFDLTMLKPNAEDFGLPYDIKEKHDITGEEEYMIYSPAGDLIIVNDIIGNEKSAFIQIYRNVKDADSIYEQYREQLKILVGDEIFTYLEENRKKEEEEINSLLEIGDDFFDDIF